MPLRGEHLPHIRARAHERDARRRYQATIAAALESFRYAEQRFDESSAAIDVHIQLALAAYDVWVGSEAGWSARSVTNPESVVAPMAASDPALHAWPA